MVGLHGSPSTDVIHVVNETMPSQLLAVISLPCIIVNTNESKNEESLGVRLVCVSVCK